MANTKFVPPPYAVQPDPSGIPDTPDTGGDLGATARAGEAVANKRPHRRLVGLADIHKHYGKKKRK